MNEIIYGSHNAGDVIVHEIIYENLVLLVRHMYPMMKVRESFGRHTKTAMRP